MNWTWIILIYFLVMNIVALITCWIDKRKAVKDRYRIQEKTLIIMAVLGGSVGLLIGMKVCRHKTKHRKFTIGVPLILVLQMIIAAYFIF